MEVRDEHVPEELFSEFVERLPQVCVEIVVETDEGLLVAKRENRPRVWFWPGSRLYKGEELDAAAHRIADDELGIDVTIEERLGVYTHFWDADEVDYATGRHTVNVVYRVTPTADDPDVTLDEQHSDYRFLSAVEPDLHEYVRRYITDNDLL